MQFTIKRIVMIPSIPCILDFVSVFPVVCVSKPSHKTHPPNRVASFLDHPNCSISCEPENHVSFFGVWCLLFSGIIIIIMDTPKRGIEISISPQMHDLVMKLLMTPNDNIQKQLTIMEKLQEIAAPPTQTRPFWIVNHGIPRKQPELGKTPYWIENPGSVLLKKQPELGKNILIVGKGNTGKSSYIQHLMSHLEGERGERLYIPPPFNWPGYCNDRRRRQPSHPPRIWTFDEVKNTEPSSYGFRQWLIQERERVGRYIYVNVEKRPENGHALVYKKTVDGSFIPHRRMKSRGYAKMILHRNLKDGPAVIWLGYDCDRMEWWVDGKHVKRNYKTKKEIARTTKQNKRVVEHFPGCKFHYWRGKLCSENGLPSIIHSKKCDSFKVHGISKEWTSSVQPREMPFHCHCTNWCDCPDNQIVSKRVKITSRTQIFDEFIVPQMNAFIRCAMHYLSDELIEMIFDMFMRKHPVMSSSTKIRLYGGDRQFQCW